MPNRIDIPPGTAFGRWTVIEEAAGLPPRGDRAMFCRCECGAEKIVRLDHLRSGRTMSCGCAQRDMVRLDVPPGTAFGRLTVIEEAPRTSSGKRSMLCQCECGERRVMVLARLRSGQSRSCGCNARGHGAKLSGLKLGEVPLHGKKAAGRVALVDEEDYDLVMQYRWHIFEIARRGRLHGPYATARIKCEDGSWRDAWMHTLLTGWPLTDHVDGNGLNNHRSNLRAATNAQNVRNGRPRGGTSQFKGVTWYRARRKWHAAIMLNGKRHHLGYFTDEVEAARAYDAAAVRLHGEFARLNFPATGAVA